jgi:GntR family histidine utilization transcriptional repressor
VTVISLHQRIISDIEAGIRQGKWRPGDRLPYEQALIEEYNCSRMTVSKALSTLAERGMIVRKRRAGSFVAPPPMDLTVMQIQDIGSDAELAGHHYDFAMLSRKIDLLGEAEAEKLGEAAGTEVLRLECLHIVDERPHAIERRVIVLESVPQARREMFAAKPPNSWLLLQAPWSEAKHVIRAISADAAIARALKIPKGTACLVLTRQTWQQDRTVTYVDIIHAGDRYQFAGVFRPNSSTANSTVRTRIDTA